MLRRPGRQSFRWRIGVKHRPRHRINSRANYSDVGAHRSRRAFGIAALHGSHHRTVLRV
jgi:hypothetical protein